MSVLRKSREGPGKVRKESRESLKGPKRVKKGSDRREYTESQDRVQKESGDCPKRLKREFRKDPRKVRGSPESQ